MSAAIEQVVYSNLERYAIFLNRLFNYPNGISLEARIYKQMALRKMSDHGQIQMLGKQMFYIKAAAADGRMNDPLFWPTY